MRRLMGNLRRERYFDGRQLGGRQTKLIAMPLE